MMGVEFFRWIHGIQEIDRDNGRRVRNVFQTNGLLLNDQYLELMRETADFVPNISMDGPDFITRRTRGVSSSRYDRLFSWLQEQSVPFGVAVVASAEVVAHKDAVADYFKSRGISNIGLVPYHSFTESDRTSSPTARFSDDGLAILDDHVTLRDPPPPPTALYDLTFPNSEGQEVGHHIDDVTVLGKALFKGVLQQSLHSGCSLSSFSDGCHRRAFCIAVNGEIYPCPRGQNVSLWNYGNVLDDGLESWYESTFGPPPFRPALPAECSECRHQKLCHGGCPANAKSMNGGADRRDFYCPSFVRLFDAAEEVISREYDDFIQFVAAGSRDCDFTSPIS